MRAIGVALLFVAAAAQAQTPIPDGTWTGSYTCTQHRFRSDQGPFVWSLPFEIEEGRISAQRDHLDSHAGALRTVFAGKVQSDGQIEIAVVLRSPGDQSENFHQLLTGRAAKSSVVLDGMMLGPRGVSVRSCRLSLTR